MEISQLTSNSPSSNQCNHTQGQCLFKQIVEQKIGEGTYNGEICAQTSHRNGSGTYINGVGKYTGNWMDDYRHGFGMIKWNIGGDHYEGEWRRGCMHGQGTFTWSNGDCYTGGWVNGVMEGQGCKVFANGDSYSGQWKNDKANGFGVKKFLCGDRHEGSYVDDRRQGFGKYFWKSGDRYEGNWENGRMCGEGVKYMASGDVYNGQWRDDLADGVGMKIFASGDRHAGEYRRDIRHGFGTYYWSNGDNFTGTWVNGNQKGTGTYVFSNGDCFKGKWNDSGRKHGQGIFTSILHQYSLIEKWEHGVRTERISCQFIPPRLLRTERGEEDYEITPHTVRLRYLRSDEQKEQDDQCSPREQQQLEVAAQRIRNEINRLQNRLIMIETAATEGIASSPSSSSPSSSSSSSVNESEAPTQSCVAGNHMEQEPSADLRAPTSTDESSSCKICFEASINCVLIHCGHMAVCMECSAMLLRCPVCRANIDNVIRTYRV